MVRRRDPFWDYVEELNPYRFRCKFCKLDFSGGIPRIKSHLSGIKCRGILACKKVSDQVRQQAKLEIENHGNVRLTGDSELENSSKRSRTTVTSTEVGDKESSECSSRYFSRAFFHDNFTPETIEKDNSIVDEKLAKFLVSNNMGFDVVETPSFADFVRGVAECGSEYKLPSSSMLQRKSLPRVQLEVEKYTSNVKDSWKKTGCTIMLGLCHNFIHIIAYSLEGALFMRLHEVSQHHSLDFVKEEIIPSLIEEIGVDHVVQFITDDAAIFHSIRPMLSREYPRIYMVRCVAHEINSLLKEIHDEFRWVEVAIGDAKSIVSYIYAHVSILSVIRQFTNYKELKHTCQSMFASNYQMLQSIFNNKHELLQLVTSDSWRQLNSEDEKKRITDIINSDEFWNQAQQVLRVMKPLVQVLRLVEDDRCTSGYLYEAMEKAKEAMKVFSNDSEKIMQIIEMRRESIINPMHAAAAFLNPAYMCRMKFKEDGKLKEGIEFMLEKLVDNEEKESFLKEVQLYRCKVSKVFTPMAYQMLETTHPSIWWDFCASHLPVLRKYAIRILSQPCKCSFGLKHSAFEVAHAMKVNRAMLASQSSILCTTVNTMIMEKFSILEEKRLSPISLEKCDELPDCSDPCICCRDDQVKLIDVTPAEHALNTEADFYKYFEDLPVLLRDDAVMYEAGARVRDPVYGCVDTVSALQQQIASPQIQLELAQDEVVCLQTSQTATYYSHHNHRGFIPPSSSSSNGSFTNF